MKINRETIIKEIQNVMREKGVKQLTRAEFKAFTGISSRHIYNLFDSWGEVCELAGLKPHVQCTTISDDDLFEEMRRVFTSNGSICTQLKLEKLCIYGINTYKRRFGKWPDVKFAFRQWLKLKEIEFPFIDKLPSVPSNGVAEIVQPKGQNTPNGKQWQAIGGTTYGPVINFRGLLHAPLNEQGVVFLFGMVCLELGFRVEVVRTAYPDCEAKRCIDMKRNKWERVNVEFEFKSRQFKEHGHKPELCDVIVCWEHDWLECPLEVVELKTAIKALNE